MRFVRALWSNLAQLKSLFLIKVKDLHAVAWLRCITREGSPRQWEFEEILTSLIVSVSPDVIYK